MGISTFGVPILLDIQPPLEEQTFARHPRVYRHERVFQLV